MATLVYGMNQSLDGYVDHDRFAPDDVLFGHFIAQTRSLTGSICGRRLYELMHYWDVDQPGWTSAEQEFAQAWRRVPKWVVSTTLQQVGPNTTLVSSGAIGYLSELKARLSGEIEVGGTVLARSLSDAGLIDEYRIYLHPAVLGNGTPFFNGFTPRLKLADLERIGESAVRISYVPVKPGEPGLIRDTQP